MQIPARIAKTALVSNLESEQHKFPEKFKKTKNSLHEAEKEKS